MWTNARGRYKRKNLDFNISIEDIIIPEKCPILGISLFFSNDKTYNTPSLDRIDNTKGYVKDNIRVVSLRANFLKSDSTFEEIETLYKNWNNK